MSGFGTVRVVFRPAWVNGWFLRVFARPFVRVDGREHRASWLAATIFVLSAEEHTLQAFVRYRATRWDLGRATLRLDVEVDTDITLAAGNGAANYTPFTLSRT